MNNSNLSVGAYFKNRCPDFGRMLSKTESPDRSCMPSITEGKINLFFILIVMNIKNWL